MHRGASQGIENRFVQASKYIKLQEGCSLKAYVCSGGNRTIGYGTSWGPNRPNRISKDLADRMFFFELIDCEEYIKTKITVRLFDYEWVALCDHVYNLGSLSNNIITLVNEYKMEEAAKIMSKYVYAGGKVSRGLQRRVKGRVELFLGKKMVNLQATSKKDILICTASKQPTYLEVSTVR